MFTSPEEVVPSPGEWPVDPQEDVPISEDRLWVDGCFDFSHHGHAGAMLQARKLGNELCVGVHSDESILENKGPTVMTLQERVAAVEACRWVTRCVPHAPYVTYLPWVSHYGCQYVVHGDDITSDSDGNDCYRFVKAAGRFRVVKRTPGISTTDLVGRMLLCTKGHFVKSVQKTLAGEEGSGNEEERRLSASTLKQRICDYATDESGLQPGPHVWIWDGSSSAKFDNTVEESGSFETLVGGKPPKPGQRIVYVDGGFDLFSSGHIEFLRQVLLYEEAAGRERGWFDPEQRNKRLDECGEDYGPAYVVAGIHDDDVINHWKGLNYPIMNIFERGLCVLQCRYIHGVIFSAPFSPSEPYLKAMPLAVPDVVYHGPTTFIPLTYDPYSAPKRMGIFKETNNHLFQHVNAGEIVERILKSREAYEERQRAKVQKGIIEELEKSKEATN
ncbi:ethanolamine-phosphate cytidylyltransferase [Aspergillus affinis]|uniref:ethanolamine-phosphate cytidylyltransferase n=1 Tax=Aspergillus affinis TaxID=1070780 RepID=UPI0022FF0827|nr:choline phosphate cytidylyltransferase/putative CDP-ethanolamine synthase [Aspergillus affinis]KAI9039271.1 choline phosphate cytidylyltransferase/putative CDP-ethanolamine synthase [Aspergillus affinis]